MKIWNCSGVDSLVILPIPTLFIVYVTDFCHLQLHYKFQVTYDHV